MAAKEMVLPTSKKRKFRMRSEAKVPIFPPGVEDSPVASGVACSLAASESESGTFGILLLTGIS